MHIICGRNESEMIWGRRGDAAEVYRRHELNGEKGGEGITEEEGGGGGGGISFFPTPHFEFCTHDFFSLPRRPKRRLGSETSPKCRSKRECHAAPGIYLQQPLKRARSPQFGMSVEILSPVFSHLCPERACPGGQSGHLLFPFVFQED